MTDTTAWMGLVDAARVLLAQALLYGVIPLLALRLPPRAPASWLTALAWGLAAQAVTGSLANALVPRGQYMEPWIYVGGWTAVRLALRRAQPARPAGEGDLLLVVLLLVAVAVRWIHPLQTWALGQSDAYAHLQYLQNVLMSGRLSNAAYPPGFAWLLALPVAIFRIEPYEMCRYGGAFHGAALVLGVYVLAHAWAGRRAARACAALVAGCPVWSLLAKTGVGCFANQVGLFALPVAWWAYTEGWVGNRQHGALALMGATGALLAATVPMMLLQVVLLFGVARLLAFRFDGWSRGWRGTLLLGALAGPALLLLAVQAGGAGDAVRDQTVGFVVSTETGAKAEPAPVEGVAEENRAGDPARPLVNLARDFLSVKRWGYGSPLFNAAAAGSLALFAAVMFLGLRRSHHALSLPGLWGVLTSLQTHTGWLQFSSYQREGWSLLIGAALLAGWAVAWLADHPSGRGVLRWPWRLCIAASFAGLWWPPAHRVFASAAEDDLVRLLRALNGDVQARAAWPGQQDLWERTGPTQRVRYVARRISGFEDGIGDPVDALRGLTRMLHHEIAQPVPGVLYVVLLDRPDDRAIASSGVMAKLQPESTAAFVRHQATARDANAALETAVAALGVPFRRWSASPRLDVLLLEAPP